MTSPIDSIQALIEQIDSTLSKPVSRLPWAASGQISQQRHVLQQVRDYLVVQRSQSGSAQTPPTTTALDPSEVDAQQTMQSMIREINELRSTLLRPLQSDVIILTQQRNALMQDLRRLEAHKHSQLLQSSNTSDLTSSQVDQLQRVNDRAAQMLGTLDTTLRVVFESLRQDIEAYQASLSQGLEKLHGLGGQGEILLTTWVNRLAQQLGHETSSYFPSQEATSSEVSLQSTPLASLVSYPSIAPNPSQTVFDPAKISLPYPGTELPSNSHLPEIFCDESASIHTLTDLLAQLPLETKEASNTLTKATHSSEEDWLP